MKNREKWEEPWKALGCQGEKSFFCLIVTLWEYNFKGKIVYQNSSVSKISSIQIKCNPVKTYLFDIDKNTFEKVIWE